jgi:hypothetical protein
MANNKVEYTEISRAKITDTRSIIISECSKGGFTVAQRMEVTEDNGKKTQVYLKGASHINDLQGLYNLRDAINLAIKKVEQNISEADNWDEVD